MLQIPVENPSASLSDQISWFTKPKSKWQSFDFIHANRPEIDVSLFERPEKTWLLVLKIKNQIKVRTGVNSNQHVGN